MGALAILLGLPVSGPLLGLGWLARRIAEAADLEMANPARIEAAIAALERQLEAGEISESEFDTQEAGLLAELASLQMPAAKRHAP